MDVLRIRGSSHSGHSDRPKQPVFFRSGSLHQNRVYRRKLSRVGGDVQVAGTPVGGNLAQDGSPHFGVRDFDVTDKQ